MPNQKAVLVVEDDPGMRRVIERILRLHGFAVGIFESADAFVAHANPDEALCLVLDINLHGASGIELKRSLRASGSSLPVIFVTGGASEHDRAEAMNAGCVALLEKPFSARALIEPISRLLPFT